MAMTLHRRHGGVDSHSCQLCRDHGRKVRQVLHTRGRRRLWEHRRADGEAVHAEESGGDGENGQRAAHSHQPGTLGHVADDSVSDYGA